MVSVVSVLSRAPQNINWRESESDRGAQNIQGVQQNKQDNIIYIFYIKFNHHHCREKTRLEKYFLYFSLSYVELVVVVVYALGTLADNQFGLGRR